jgi:purine-cytosine permease-like protein
VATNDEELKKFAKKKLKAKQDFRNLATVWVFVTALLTAIWFFTTPGAYFWPIWPAFGIGIGLLFAGYEAYGKGFDRPITDDDIDAEVKRLKKNDGN